MEAYQLMVRKLRDEFRLNMPVEHSTIDLAAEVGELGKEILLSTDYGTKPFAATANLEAEFGDVFYALIGLANELQVDLDQALRSRVDSYRERFAARRIEFKSGAME
jgi:NTP pyrophosphatase (non-canonical NTP hydrolase)